MLERLRSSRLVKIFISNQTNRYIIILTLQFLLYPFNIIHVWCIKALIYETLIWKSFRREISHPEFFDPVIFTGIVHATNFPKCIPA